jgi:hypothetical protein
MTMYSLEGCDLHSRNRRQEGVAAIHFLLYATVNHIPQAREGFGKETFAKVKAAVALRNLIRTYNAFTHLEIAVLKQVRGKLYKKRISRLQGRADLCSLMYLCKFIILCA